MGGVLMWITCSKNSDAYDIREIITGIELDMNKTKKHRLALFKTKCEALYLMLKEEFGLEKE